MFGFISEILCFLFTSEFIHISCLFCFVGVTKFKSAVPCKRLVIKYWLAFIISEAFANPVEIFSLVCLTHHTFPHITMCLVNEVNEEFVEKVSSTKWVPFKISDEVLAHEISSSSLHHNTTTHFCGFFKCWESVSSRRSLVFSIQCSFVPHLLSLADRACKRSNAKVWSFLDFRIQYLTVISKMFEVKPKGSWGNFNFWYWWTYWIYWKWKFVWMLQFGIIEPLKGSPDNLRQKVNIY